MNRRHTRQLKVGNLAIGSGSPISVQTMATANPHDECALIRQTASCVECGCDIMRLTVPDEAAAKILGNVRKEVPIPLVADIHFDYRCALAAIEAGADALRLNPGNIGGQDRVKAVARAAKERGVPIRIGVNGGSLEKGETLVSSALKHAAMLEEEGFADIVISAKASNVTDTLAAYRELAAKTDYPLHLGVTEAGTLLPGAIRSSVAMGILLSEGIGDTIRVSLTDKPEREVKAGLEILRSLGLRKPGPAITSCPTCGRTKVNLFKVAMEVEDALERRCMAMPDAKVPRIAVMGCVVNGPGEAKGADVALCGGNGEFFIYVHGERVGSVSEADAARKVMEYAFPD